MENLHKVDLATARVAVGSLTTFPLVPPIEGSVFFEEVGRSKLHPLSRATCVDPASPSEYYGLWNGSSNESNLKATTYPSSLLDSAPFMGSPSDIPSAPESTLFDEKIAIPVAINDHFAEITDTPLRVHHRDPLFESSTAKGPIHRTVRNNFVSIVTPCIGRGTGESLSFDPTGRSIGASLVRDISDGCRVREIRITNPTIGSGTIVEGCTLVEQIYDVVAAHCNDALQAACRGEETEEGAAFVVTGLDSLGDFTALQEELHIALWALCSLLRHYATHETTTIRSISGTALRTYSAERMGAEVSDLQERRQEEQRRAKKRGTPTSTIHQQMSISAIEDSLQCPPLQTPFDFIHSRLSKWFVRVVVLLPPHLQGYPTSLARHLSRTLCVGAASIDYAVLSPVSQKGGTLTMDTSNMTVTVPTCPVDLDGSLSTTAVDMTIDAAVDYMVTLHNDRCDSEGDGIHPLVPIVVPSVDAANKLRRAIEDQYTSEPMSVVFGFGADTFLTVASRSLTQTSTTPPLTFVVCISGSSPIVRCDDKSLVLTPAAVEEGLVSLGVRVGENEYVSYSMAGTVIHLGMNLNVSGRMSLAGRDNLLVESLSLCKLLSPVGCEFELRVDVPHLTITDGTPLVRLNLVCQDISATGDFAPSRVSRLGKCLLEMGRRLRSSDLESAMGVSVSDSFYKGNVLASEQKHKLRANRRLQKQRDHDSGIAGNDGSDNEEADIEAPIGTLYQQSLPKDVNPASQLFFSLRLVAGPAQFVDSALLNSVVHFLIHGDFIAPTQILDHQQGISMAFVLTVLGQRITGALLPCVPCCRSGVPTLPFMKFAVCAASIGVAESHILSKLEYATSNLLVNENGDDNTSNTLSTIEVLLRIPLRSVHFERVVADSRTSSMIEFCSQRSWFPLKSSSVGGQFLMSPFVQKERLVPTEKLLGSSLGTQVPCRGWYTESAPVVVPEAVLYRDGEYLSLDHAEGESKQVSAPQEVNNQAAIMAAIIQRNITSLSAAHIVTDAKKSTRQKRGRRVEVNGQSQSTSERVASVATPLGLSQEVDLTGPGMGYMKPLTAVSRFPSVLSEVVKVSVVDPIASLGQITLSNTLTIPAASLDLCLVVKALLRNAMFNACVVLDGPAVLSFLGSSGTLGDTNNALVAAITSNLRGVLAGSELGDIEAALAAMVVTTLMKTSCPSKAAQLRPSGSLCVSHLSKGLGHSSTFVNILSSLLRPPSTSQSSVWADSLSSAFEDGADGKVLLTQQALSRDNMLHTSAGIPSSSGVCAHTQFRSLDVTQSVKKMSAPKPIQPNDKEVNVAESSTTGPFVGAVPERGEDKIIERVIQSIRKVGRAKVERASKGKPMFGFLDPSHALHPYYLNELKEQGIHE